jgi:uncharacterized ParB-like nuclease family protein
MDFRKFCQEASMKKATALFSFVAFVMVLSAGLFAAAPEKIVLNAKLGNVAFSHKVHAETMKIACTTCHHGLKEGEIPAKCGSCHGVDVKALKAQDAFHTLCSKGCHKKENEANKKNAPVKCIGCHVKA